MYSHILVPTDGSDVAQRGVDHALALARLLGARVTIMTVTEPLPSYSGFVGTGMVMGSGLMANHDDQQARYANSILTKAQVHAAAEGVAVSVLHVPDAYAAEAIVEAAKSKEAALIVMASHGRRGLDRLLIGSQTSAVVNQSTVPVLVVK